MRKLLEKLQASDGLRQSVLTIGGNIVATGLSAVALILISRVLGPIKFGEFSVGFALIMILNRLNDLGLNAAITKFVPHEGEDHQKINQIFGFASRIKFVFSVILIGVGLLVSPLIASVLHFPQPHLIYLAFILSVCSTWYEQLLAMLQSLHRFFEAVVVNGLQASFKMVGALILYVTAFNQSLPVFVFYMVAPLVPLLASKWLLPSWVKWGDRSLDKAHQLKIVDMAKHSAVGFVAAGLIENIDVLFVQGYLSPFETGLLAGVSRIAMMLLLVAYSLGNVLYPRVARYHERVHLEQYIKKAGILSLLALAGFIVFIPFAPLLITFTIGNEYLAGLSVLHLLAASSFITIATIPFLALFYTFKADWYFSVAGLGQLLIVVGGNMLFVPEYGLDAAAWTRLVCRLFLLAFTVSAALYLYYRQFYTRPVRTTS